MNKQLRDADTSIAFSVQGHFIAGQSLVGGRDKNTNDYLSAEPISEIGRKMRLDYMGNIDFGTNNLFHRRSMRVSGLPLFVSSLDKYSQYPTYQMKTVIAERENGSPDCPVNFSSGEIYCASGDSLMMVLHLGEEDWLDFQKVATHPQGVRFRFWFSEQIQKASGSLNGMKYHIKTDIEGISKTADRGDGSERRSSYQTLKEFDILHSGDILKDRIVFWAKLSSFGY